VESAIGEPGVLGHFADEVDFGETDGLFVFHDLGEELIVLLLLFERQDFELAGQAVPDGILRTSMPRSLAKHAKGLAKDAKPGTMVPQASNYKFKVCQHYRPTVMPAYGVTARDCGT
jgi:hypothetical protein